MKWTATYGIAEAPGYAEIAGIVADDEVEALAYAREQVGTDLTQWGHRFRLLDLWGVVRDRSTGQDDLTTGYDIPDNPTQQGRQAR